MIARAINEGIYGLVTSLELSSALDTVNIDLLINRKTIVGLQNVIVELVE
jgi:hypothetical protein